MAGPAPDEPASDPDAATAPEPDVGLVDVLRWRRVFAGEGRQLREVRYWVASVLPPGPPRDDVVSVAAELAANAIRHTASGQGGKFAVEVTWQRTVLRVAVADGGGPAHPQVIDDPAGEHGRGLLLVRGLSVRLGVEGDQRGRLVWADVPWDASALLLPDEQAEHDGRDAAVAVPGRAERAEQLGPHSVHPVEHSVGPQ